MNRFQKKTQDGTDGGHPGAGEGAAPRRWPGWLGGMSIDLKLGARMLVRYPGLTLVAVLALSVAIGGGAAYLEVVNDLVRPTLPFKDGGRIVGIYNQDASAGAADERVLHDFLTWRDELKTVEAVGAFRTLERNLITADGRTEPVQGVEISASAFRIAGVAPLLGRPLVAEDEDPGAPPTVVLGHALWQARFGGDPGVVGRDIRLGSTVHRVVGVMPDGFTFPVNHRMWVPLRVRATDYQRGQGPALKVFGRLAPGADLASAQAELSALGRRAAADFPETNRHLRPRVKPYVSALWASIKDGSVQVGILYAVNLFFLGLLAVCGANVATLVFARTATREGEITVRTALGASRGRLVAQFFAEALVLAAGAAAVGLAAAYFGLKWVKGTVVAAGGVPPFWWSDGLSPATFAYAGALTLLTAMLVGGVPALKATGPRLQARLKEAAVAGSGMRFGGVWTGVIVAQVGLTVIFLLIVVSVGWNVRVGRYGTTEYAFQPREYLSVQLEMDGEVMPGEAGERERAQFATRFRTAYEELERRLMAEPGVAEVTYGNRLPGMTHIPIALEVEGAPALPGGEAAHSVRTAEVGVGFFQAFGAPIVTGRPFEPGDVEAGRDGIVVDQRFAAQVLGGRDPIGVRVREAAIERDRPGPWYRVVGVARNLAASEDQSAVEPVMYRAAAPGDAYPVFMAVHVRGDARTLAPRLRALAAEVDPTLRLSSLMPMDEIGKAGRFGLGLMARALAVVGVVSLLLSTAGVYSLMSFTVTRRTREIGIRAAVGATPRRILTGIFRPALTQVGIGVVAGAVPGTLLVLWGLPEVAEGAGVLLAIGAFLAITAFMMGVALLALVIPARRALRIQPTEALRAAG